MGHPAGMKRDFEALEQRRVKAAKLLEQGVPQAEVARRVGAHRQSVSRWAQTLNEKGRAGLKHPGRAGRKPGLDEKALQRIERALKKGPEAYGYPTALWTTERVAELIEREFEVRYHPGHVWRILRRLGWSCQRPSGKARERDERAIAHWKKVTWPEVKKTPREKAGRSSSSTRAGSAKGHTDAGPGRRAGKPPSSSSTSTGTPSR
jgi:transposase